MNYNELSFYKRATDFFLTYCLVDENSLTYDEVLPKQLMQDCAKLLIENGVFTIEGMKKEALKSHWIILPEWVFDTIYKE